MGGKKKTIWNRDFILIFVINFCYQMVHQMMNTLVPKYANSFGIAATLVGVISSIFAVGSMASRPITSPALDAFKKKKMLLLVMVMMSLVFWGYSMTSNAYAIIGIRLIHGICIGFFSPLVMMMAGDALPENRLGSGISIFALGQAIGQAVGPSIGLSMSKHWGYSPAFQVGAVVMLATALLCFLLPNDNGNGKPYKIALNRILDKDAVPAGLIILFLCISFGCISAYLAIYGEARGVDNIGLYFTVYAISLLISRPVSGILSDKFGFAPMIGTGIVCYGISFVLLSFSRTIGLFLVAAVVAALGYGVCQPQVQALTLRCVTKERRGVGSNTNFFFMDAGMMIGPTCAGYVIDSIAHSTGGVATADAYSKMYLVMTVPMIIAFLYLVMMKGRIKKIIEKNQSV